MSRLASRLPRLTALQLGSLLLALALTAGLLLFNKGAISTALSSGDELVVELARDYRLRPNQTSVKVAGIPVGVVTGVERAGENTRVALKLDKGTMRKLGTAPSAAVRPTTLLGGNYYVALSPGGDPGAPSGNVPVERTTVPVELDRVLERVGPDQQAGIRTSVAQVDGTLSARGSAAAKELLADAPAVLDPAADVLGALRGREPADDLGDLVSGLESTGRALAAERAQLDGMLSAAAGAAATLGDRREAVADTLAAAPQTLATTRAALQRLDGTLAKVRSTAPELRDGVQRSAVLVRQARPVLAEARPVVADLKVLAADLRPLLGEAVPVVRQGTEVLADVDGPVVDRLRGPVLTTVLSPYRGKTKFYEELGYMAAGLGSTAKMTDRNGASIAFHPGPGYETVGGLPPLPIDALFANLLGLEGTNP